ncbi:MAG: TonB-dependent receptor [Candidatus Eremiobacteraeota bacterium]|nr:TonB-dependent receptor [Candidatus Eremiobacteraeota bacterium]
MALATGAHAQVGRTTIAARVTDAGNGAPIAEAYVQIRFLGASAFTDSVGAARFTRVPAGRYLVEARRVGYAPATASVLVGNEDVAGVVVSMHAAPAVLSTVTVADTAVSVWLREFDQRRRRDAGRYVSQVQMESEPGASLQAILGEHVPGLRVQLGSGGEEQVVSTRSGGSCPVLVFMDGVRLADPDVSWIDPSQLGGIEYYTTGFVPVQYQAAAARSGSRRHASAGGCGALLLWSRA